MNISQEARQIKRISRHDYDEKTLLKLKEKAQK